MGPAIRDGDIITLSPLFSLIPRRGDVLAFRHPERPQMLVHRVLAKGKTHSISRATMLPQPMVGSLGEPNRLGHSRGAWREKHFLA